MNNDQVALPDIFENISVDKTDRQDLSHHPSDEFIKAYVDGQLQRGQRSHENFQTLSEGQAQDWHQSEVGLHIKTCEQCWQKMVNFRTVIITAPESVSESTPVKISWIDQLFAPFKQPTFALTGAFVLVIALLIGYQMHPWLNISIEEELPAPSTSSFGVESTSDAVVTALEDAGVPLDAFDFTAPGTDYQLQSQDTLQSIANQEYGDTSLWIGIYLFNYETLSSLEAPATDSLPQGILKLPELNS